jgi:hypothetical protein
MLLKISDAYESLLFSLRFYTQSSQEKVFSGLSDLFSSYFCEIDGDSSVFPAKSGRENALQNYQWNPLASREESQQVHAKTVAENCYINCAIGNFLVETNEIIRQSMKQ